MLTIEDIQAHERLIAALPNMALAQIISAYRDARRLYEARLWSGQDAEEAEVRSELLARTLIDLQAFTPDIMSPDGPEPRLTVDHPNSPAQRRANSMA
ncbi:MAG: hypothetical protein ACYDD1_12375 [Caulobacteraceae bacterium]